MVQVLLPVVLGLISIIGFNNMSDRFHIDFKDQIYRQDLEHKQNIEKSLIYLLSEIPLCEFNFSGQAFSGSETKVQLTEINRKVVNPDDSIVAVPLMSVGNEFESYRVENIVVERGERLAPLDPYGDISELGQIILGLSKEGRGFQVKMPFYLTFEVATPNIIKSCHLTRFIRSEYTVEDIMCVVTDVNDRIADPAVQRWVYAPGDPYYCRIVDI